MTAYRRMMQKRNNEDPAKSSVISKVIPIALTALIVMPLVIAISIITYRMLNKVETLAPGILVLDEPQQVVMAGAKSFTKNGYTLTPVATYEVSGRVNGIDYPDDSLAAIAPVDLILGWGSMSDSAVLDKLTISQSKRSFGWRYYENLPVDHAYVYKHLSLNTIIPATEDAKQVLMKIRKNNIVSMSGYLVNINASDGRTWQSSVDNNERDSNPAYYFLVNSIIIKK